MLTRYDRLGASSRLRSFQYLPAFEAAGIVPTVSHLFSNKYVSSLQAGDRSLVEAARAYTRRVTACIGAGKYDLIWMEKETLPWLPAFTERVLLPAGVPFVLDYDDAVYHYYDQHRWAGTKRMLADKHEKLIRASALTIVGNNYLANYASKAGARQVEIVPTAVDLDRYCSERKRSDDSTAISVVWVGQEATARCLRPVAPIVEKLSKEGSFKFFAVGIDARRHNLLMESVPWSEHDEVETIRSADIGIMPLSDSPLERGKCGYKLIQYMACGLPVVASPVGANKNIVDHGVNGFLADSLGDWEWALNTLRNDPELRQRMGAAGRRLVEQEYCTKVTAPKLVRFLKGIRG